MNHRVHVQNSIFVCTCTACTTESSTWYLPLWMCTTHTRGYLIGITTSEATLGINYLGTPHPVWARKHCRISPPCFLAKGHMRRLNQASFVSLYFVFAFSGLSLTLLVGFFDV